MKRRLAATAATAALAVGAPATAAKPNTARGKSPTKPRVSKLAAAESAGARQSLEAMRRAEIRAHRRQLAGALAAELPDAGAPEVERGLAAASVDPAALGASLARSTGASEQQVEDAFEAMARNALARRVRAKPALG